MSGEKPRFIKEINETEEHNYLVPLSREAQTKLYGLVAGNAIANQGEEDMLASKLGRGLATNREVVPLNFKELEELQHQLGKSFRTPAEYFQDRALRVQVTQAFDYAVEFERGYIPEAFRLAFAPTQEPVPRTPRKQNVFEKAKRYLSRKGK